MKKIILVLLFITATFLCVNAQDSLKVKKSPQERAAQIGKALQKKLHLTADQSAKVNAILTDRAGKVAALQGQKGVRGEREKLMADADTQIEALLTDPQKKLYIQMKAYNKEKNMAQNGKKIAPQPVVPSPL